MEVEPDDLLEAAVGLSHSLRKTGLSRRATSVGTFVRPSRMCAMPWGGTRTPPHRVAVGYDSTSTPTARRPRGTADVLEATAATLAQIASAAPDAARGYHNAGVAGTCGFLAMGCDEILVHGLDFCLLRPQRWGTPGIGRSLGPDWHAEVSQPALSVTEATSALVSLIAAAATLSSKCDTDPVPGIGRIEGDRARSQASTICRGVAS